MQLITGQALPSGVQMLFSFTAGEVTRASKFRRNIDKEKRID